LRKKNDPPPSDDDDEEEEDDDEVVIVDKKKKKLGKEDKDKDKKKEKEKEKQKQKQKEEEEEEEDDWIDEDEDDEDEDDDEDDDDDKFAIVFRGGGGGGRSATDTLEDEYLDAMDEDEQEECDSEDEQIFMKESYEKVETANTVVASSSSVTTVACRPQTTVEEDDDEETDEDETLDVDAEYKELLDLKKLLAQKLARTPASTRLQKAIDECNESIRDLIKRGRAKNAKKYYGLVQDSTQQDMGEIQYFKKKMSNQEQLKIMQQLEQVNDHMLIKKPYRLLLLESDIPAKYKAAVMQKVNVLKSMDPSNSEYYKLKTWVEAFMRIPLGVHKSLSVNITDGIDKCHAFMETAKSTLDNCVYGLDDAKMQIMQMIGQWITNPGAMGTAIAIKGPPGTGKTSLVKEGISKILGREFSFIALGGTGDASFLEGHSYTYEGSLWGKVVQILMDSKCMNPVIYFDELDKVSETFRGEEIVGILTHLTDTSQNSQFHDKYFAEIDFDLSKCLFIFSYNNEAKVNPILRDRMYRIETKGYDLKQKMIIARNFLLPKIREQVKFDESEVNIPDETLQYIISSEYLTHKEEGVRNLKRCLEIIHTKLNLFRLMKPDTNLFAAELDLKEVRFPITVTVKMIEIFIKNEEKQNQSLLSMYC
jgi:ATP-dependent Lon protease